MKSFISFCFLCLVVPLSGMSTEQSQKEPKSGKIPGMSTEQSQKDLMREVTKAKKMLPEQKQKAADLMRKVTTAKNILPGVVAEVASTGGIATQGSDTAANKKLTEEHHHAGFPKLGVDVSAQGSLAQHTLAPEQPEELVEADNAAYTTVVEGKECQNNAQTSWNKHSAQACADWVSSQSGCGQNFERNSANNRCSCLAPGVSCNEKNDVNVVRYVLGAPATEACSPGASPVRTRTNMNAWYSDRVAHQEDCDWQCTNVQRGCVQGVFTGWPTNGTCRLYDCIYEAACSTFTTSDECPVPRCMYGIDNNSGPCQAFAMDGWE